MKSVSSLFSISKQIRTILFNNIFQVMSELLDLAVSLPEISGFMVEMLTSNLIKTKENKNQLMKNRGI